MSTAWTEEQLATLPIVDGVRQRGVEITRLETFCDAAFAFAVTLLVIGGDGIPKSYSDLTLALKGVPAFAASFTVIAGLWWSHRTWSRRYGLEDDVTTVVSLTFVFIMLIYVYPLKMVFSAFAGWLSGGWLPTEFVMSNPTDMLGIFVVYGVGFAIQTGMLGLLHWRVLKVTPELNLNEVEQLRTKQQIVQNLILGAIGIASAIWAIALPPQIGIYAGFIYMILPITMPILSSKYVKQVERLQGR